jgi:hypothetical protein
MNIDEFVDELKELLTRFLTGKDQDSLDFVFAEYLLSSINMFSAILKNTQADIHIKIKEFEVSGLDVKL